MAVQPIIATGDFVRLGNKPALHSSSLGITACTRCSGCMQYLGQKLTSVMSVLLAHDERVSETRL